MFISTQEVFCLIKNSLWDLINILAISMLTFRLPSSSLLTKAYAFSRFIDSVFLNLFFAATYNSIMSKIILRIFREEMLTGNFSDGWVEVSTLVKFLQSSLVRFSLSTSWRLIVRTSGVHRMILIKYLVTSLNVQRLDFWQLYSWSSIGRTVGLIVLPTDRFIVCNLLLWLISLDGLARIYFLQALLHI